MLQSLISIIIPVHNHASALARSLASLLAQSYRPLEVIIVDDGSTDNLSAVLEKTIVNGLLGQSIPVTVIHQAKSGASSARNAGAKLAKGDFLLFWDADTIAKPTMIRVMYDTLLKHPEAMYAYSQFVFGYKTMRSQPFRGADLKQTNFIDTTSLLRRSAFLGFDEALSRFQDWDLWLTLLEQGKVGIFIPQVLFKKLVGGRVGMSAWLPRFFYHLPWKTRAVVAYETARQIIAKKHHLSG